MLAEPRANAVAGCDLLFTYCRAKIKTNNIAAKTLGTGAESDALSLPMVAKHVWPSACVPVSGATAPSLFRQKVTSRSLGLSDRPKGYPLNRFGLDRMSFSGTVTMPVLMTA